MAGNISPTRTPIMAITTSSSMSVNPSSLRLFRTRMNGPLYMNGEDNTDMQLQHDVACGDRRGRQQERRPTFTVLGHQRALDSDPACAAVQRECPPCGRDSFAGKYELMLGQPLWLQCHKE